MSYNPATATAPVTSAYGLGPQWFNVKKYGALGDGTTDDTTAINSAIAALNTATSGVLYFPAGTYKTTAALTTITAVCLIRGDGCASFGTPASGAISLITCTSATAVLFTMNTVKAQFQDLALKNTAGSTPTAGAGISVLGSTGGECVNYSRVSVYGFYIDIDVQVGNVWVMDACMLTAPVKYGLKVQNTVVADAGDWCVSNSAFYDTHGADAAIYMSTSGGGKIVTTKINTLSGVFQRGIDIAGAGTTSILLIANTSIENVHLNAIRQVGAWDRVQIANCELALDATAGNTAAIDLSNANHFSIVGCTCVSYNGASTVAAIALTSCTNGTIAAIDQNTYSAILSQSSCSGIVDATGGSSAYTLPTATTSVLGGVKVDGTTITIASGVISSAGGAAFSGARYTTAAGQSIPDSTTTVLNFGTSDYDTASAVTTGSSWHYTAPSTGYYLVRATAEFVAHVWGAGQVFVLSLRKNGTVVSNLDYNVFAGIANSIQPSGGGSDVVALTAGDTVDIVVFQNSGGALALQATAAYNTVAIAKL